VVETNTRKVIDRLKADGWVSLGGAKHDKYEHPGRTDTMIVPRHKELSPGVARSIAKLAGWI
jgi:predicted RNA binding protein YcfA (HicA-like mRNA interferase family)